MLLPAAASPIIQRCSFQIDVDLIDSSTSRLTITLWFGEVTRAFPLSDWN